MIERRRSSRKSPNHPIEVNNAITGETIGHIGNLSVNGLMLITTKQMQDDALFQLMFRLPGRDGHTHLLEIGVYKSWGRNAPSPGQYWAGFRIIDISAEDYNVLTDWVSG